MLPGQRHQRRTDVHADGEEQDNAQIIGLQLPAHEQQPCRADPAHDGQNGQAALPQEGKFAHVTMAWMAPHPERGAANTSEA